MIFARRSAENRQTRRRQPGSKRPNPPQNLTPAAFFRSVLRRRRRQRGRFPARYW
jgi:hypothetical protein